MALTAKLPNSYKGAWRPRRPPCVHTSLLALRNRLRSGERRYAADSRCARRQWRRSRDKEVVTLPRRRTIGICGGVAGHAATSKGVDVGVGTHAGVSRVKTVRKVLHDDHELVLLLIRQAKITDRHVDVVRDLGHRPAIYLFGRPCWTVSGSDGERKLVARVVEMDELLQALDVAVVKELLLEVRLPGAGFGGGTLWRRHGHIAHRRHLLPAVHPRCQLRPSRVRVGGGAEAASEEGA